MKRKTAMLLAAVMTVSSVNAAVIPAYAEEFVQAQEEIIETEEVSEDEAFDNAEQGAEGAAQEDSGARAEEDGADTEEAEMQEVCGEEQSADTAYAFGCGSSISSISIPNSVTGIGHMAFEYCDSLNSITIPDSVTSMGDDVFLNTDCTIICMKNSCAHSYAERNNISYKLLDANVFTDISADDWFAEDVLHVYSSGLMTGYGGTTRFAPNDVMNRAMFATVLYRIDGRPPVSDGRSFSDVEAGEYYADPVKWASGSAVGVITGYPDGRFGPNDSITREQMAVIDVQIRHL